MIDLDEARARAQRQLDGMTVNRDAMARDVIVLVDSIHAMQARAAARTRGTPESAKNTEGFSEAFDDIFGAIFKRGPKA